jgi:cation:H+ antiporter
MMIGFAGVIKGADFLVAGASQLAKRLHVSDLVIGLTVVSFGTSVPELSVCIFASTAGSTEIAVSNVLGSNIANILLILGISSVIFPLSITKGTVWKEIPLSLLAVVLVAILANDYLIDQRQFTALTRIDGLVLMSFFLVFVSYVFGMAQDVKGLDQHLPEKSHPLWKTMFMMVAGLLCLVVGSNWAVKGAIHLASALGVSESLIGLTVVAVGTSLPELATSAVAAYRRNAEIAVGNVVGSNIFNIFLVLGGTAIIRPLPFHSRDNADVGAAIIASILLFLCAFTGKRRVTDRWEGAVFLTLYVSYIFIRIRQG